MAHISQRTRAMKSCSAVRGNNTFGTFLRPLPRLEDALEQLEAERNEPIDRRWGAWFGAGTRTERNRSR